MNLQEGDIVRFKGDPEQESFTVYYVYLSRTHVDLEPSNGDQIDNVPVRLLEKLPDPPREGEVWEHRMTGSRFFITMVDGDTVFYALTGTSGDLVKADTRVFAPDKYVRVFPGKESS